MAMMPGPISEEIMEPDVPRENPPRRTKSEVPKDMSATVSRRSERSDANDIVWQHRLRGQYSTSPLVIDDQLLVVSEDGVATVFRAGTEFIAIAEHDLGETVLATPAVLDNRVYVRTAGHVLCVGEAGR
ncbi:MAG: PQQ-binding-like beta-propeller repeat protein [Planctomycetaceae bacterium]|nr:PQQ-binding-like beta-propeller repeat protein [Planctomycetaceae bacterium]